MAIVPINLLKQNIKMKSLIILDSLITLDNSPYWFIGILIFAVLTHPFFLWKKNKKNEIKYSKVWEEIAGEHLVIIKYILLVCMLFEWRYWKDLLISFKEWREFRKIPKRKN